MNKLIYLFELDSMRSSKMEVNLAQKAILHEIVKNGNIIVLTYNQIVDSNGFLFFLHNEENFQLILHFIKQGYIKFSQYYNNDEVLIASPVQYMLSNLEKNEFHFTVLPIQDNETTIKKILKESLTNVDLSPFQNGEILSPNKCSFFINFVKLLTLISLESSAINPPSAQSDFKLLKFLKNIYYYYSKSTSDINSSMIKRNLEILKQSKEFEELDKNIKDNNLDDLIQNLIVDLPNVLTKLIDNNNIQLETNQSNKFNNRSNWYTLIQDNSNHNYKPDELVLAKCIIDLCYNYAVESSIHNISLHYEWDADENNVQSSFISDFTYRLILYWINYKIGIHQCSDPAHNKLFNYSEFPLPYWKQARVLISPPISKENSNLFYAQSKSSLKNEQKIWKREILKDYLKNFYSILTFALAFCIFDYGINDLIFPYIKNTFQIVSNLMNQYLGFTFYLTNYATESSLYKFIISVMMITVLIYFIIRKEGEKTKDKENLKETKNFPYFFPVFICILVILAIIFTEIKLILLYFFVRTFNSVFFFGVIASTLNSLLELPDLLEQLQFFIKKSKSLWKLHHQKTYFHYEITIEENQLNSTERIE